MRARTCPKTIDNKENSQSRTASSVLSRQGYIDINAYILSNTHSTLSAADISNGYVLPHGDLPAACPGRTNWLSGMKNDSIGALSSIQMSGYAPNPKALLATGYVTTVASYQMQTHEISASDKLEAIIRSEESRISQLREEAENAYNTNINMLLNKNGFINRVDIKKGVTASVAVFKYVGEDQEIKAVTKNGYVMVKLPPYTLAPENINIIASTSTSQNYGVVEYVGAELPQQTAPQIHAELTYNNEFNIISQMDTVSPDETRPNVLAKQIEGQKFIFNSPVFYEEKEFIRVHESILTGELRRSLSDSDSYDEDNLSDSEDGTESRYQLAINGLLQQSFINLTGRMRRLAFSNENPVRIINTLFTSILNAVNKLHKEGFVHADIAGRNIVPRSDGTVALVDFGAADTLNKVNGNSRLNIKYPQSSIMHNIDALKPDHLIGVITDYISLQKTLLQAIADYIDADFYKLTSQNLPNASDTVTIAFLLQFTDREILNNVKNNLITAAKALAENGNARGMYALNLIRQYEPYFDHDHNPNHTFAELQAAHNESFNRCSPRAYIVKSREKTAERLHAYNNHVEERHAAPPAAAAPRPISRSNTAEKIGLFSRSRANSLSEPLARDSLKKI